jgi:hypothetical protein
VLLSRLFIALALLLTITGCETWCSDPHRQKFYRVTVTNYRGEYIAEWIAEGYVSRTDFGYRFMAVERNTAPPHVQHIQYPLGRKVDISGPNIVIKPCGEPEWLYRGYY